LHSGRGKKKIRPRDAEAPELCQAIPTKPQKRFAILE